MEKVSNLREESLERNSINPKRAKNVQENAVHGSDSDEYALKEIAFIFSDSELLST